VTRSSGSKALDLAERDEEIYRVNALPHDGNQMPDTMMVLPRNNSGTRDKQQTWRQTRSRHASSHDCGREDSSGEQRREQDQIMRDRFVSVACMGCREI
jgi:hypothetical protein